VDASPKRILARLLENHLDWVTVAEAIIIAQRLRERQYATIRQRVIELVWNERHRCQIADLVRLGQLLLPQRGLQLLEDLHQRMQISHMQRSSSQDCFGLLLTHPRIKCTQDGLDLGKGPFLPLPGTTKTLEVQIDWRGASMLYVMLLAPLDPGQQGRVEVKWDQDWMESGHIHANMPLLPLYRPSHRLRNRSSSTCWLRLHLVALPPTRKRRSTGSESRSKRSKVEGIKPDRKLRLSDQPARETAPLEQVSVAKSVSDRITVVINPALLSPTLSPRDTIRLSARDFKIAENETFEQVVHRAQKELGLTGSSRLALYNRESLRCPDQERVWKHLDRDRDQGHLLFLVKV
jgi:hypothetical protein